MVTTVCCFPGSKFLSNIRDVDVILHIVRCFEDDDVIHVDETVDPMRVSVDSIAVYLALPSVPFTFLNDNNCCEWPQLLQWPLLQCLHRILLPLRMSWC